MILNVTTVPNFTFSIHAIAEGNTSSYIAHQYGAIADPPMYGPQTSVRMQSHDANPNDVFLINIHTGGYSNPNGPNDPDFNCLYGAAIGAASGLAGYPAGTVNRATFAGISPQGSPGTTALSRGDWAAASAINMADPSYVNIGAQDLSFFE